jgi:hypothetical protein
VFVVSLQSQQPEHPHHNLRTPETCGGSVNKTV